MKKVRYYLSVILFLVMVSALFACSNKQSKEIGFNPEALNKLAGGNYNIILITTDQEHYFKAYPEGTDYEGRQRLAALGTTFEKNYICSNVSSSSRSVIYTGRHITDTNVHDNIDFKALQQPMDSSVKTVGSMMGDLGYYSAFKGKSHFAESTSQEALIPKDDGGERLPQTQKDMEPYGFFDWNPDGDYEGAVNQGYTKDPVIASSSIGWLRSTGMHLNEGGKPFFLAINLVNPHDIMYANADGDGDDTRENEDHLFPITKPPSDALYSKTYEKAPISKSALVDVDATKLPANYEEYKKVDEMSFGKAPSSEAEWRRFQDYYYNAIQDNDNNLVTILDEIENQHLMKNTIIVFTSDHGDMLGAHQLRGKGGFMYENNIHVPLVIVHPEFEGGKSVNALTSSLDLTPTFVDFTKATESDKKATMGTIQGKSLMPLLENPKAEMNALRDGALFLFSDLQMVDATGQVTTKVDAAGNTVPDYKMDLSKRGILRGIVDGRYKFARYFAPNNFNTPTTFEMLLENNDIELYDLKNDPEEMDNLGSNPEKNKDLIMTMNAKLNGLIEKEVGIDDGKEFTAAPINGNVKALSKDV